MEKPIQNSVFQLLNVIRSRPGMYLCGEKSLKRLCSFITGYEVGLAQKGGAGFVDGDRLIAFQAWLANRWKIPLSGKGWSRLILERSTDDQAAFDMFFELLDDFMAETNRPVD